MSSSHATPRRRREPGDRNRNIYRRYDGRFEIGYRDSTGRQRWTRAYDTVTAARAARDDLLGRKARGDRVQPNPRLRFSVAADRWLGGQVVDLRPATQAIYRNAIDNHLRPRWGRHRLDAITVDDAANLVRLQPRVVLDLTARWPLNEAVELFGRVENLWDEDYQTTAGYASPGRGAFVGARLRL